MSDDLDITNYGYYKIIDEDRKWIIFKSHPYKSWENYAKNLWIGGKFQIEDVRPLPLPSSNRFLSSRVAGLKQKRQWKTQS